MGNQQLLPCCAACYDSYEGYGCCLPVQFHDSQPRQEGEPVFRPSWSWQESGKRGLAKDLDNDDDSYIENYRFSISGDDKEKTSTPRSTLTSCRHSSFTRRLPLDAPSASFSSQVSDSEGASSARGMECRSDPSMIRRTTTSQCEREDVDDDIDEIAFLSRSSDSSEPVT